MNLYSAVYNIYEPFISKVHRYGLCVMRGSHCFTCFANDHGTCWLPLVLEHLINVLCYLLTLSAQLTVVHWRMFRTCLAVFGVHLTSSCTGCHSLMVCREYFSSRTMLPSQLPLHRSMTHCGSL